MVTANRERVSWVVLVYRVPREPSSPRIAIWRRLKALGVAQLGDGVVALPEDARTREHLEWVADQVVAAGGIALPLRAQTLSRRDERALAQAMSDARAVEYRHLIGEIGAAAETPGAQARTLKRLRRELRNVQRRDYFPPPERDEAIAALNRLASAVTDSAQVASITGGDDR